MRKFLLASVGLLAVAFAGAPGGFTLPPMERISGGYISGGRAVGGSAKTQRHTGAGGAGMHRAWKRRRASGRS